MGEETEARGLNNVSKAHRDNHERQPRKDDCEKGLWQ